MTTRPEPGLAELDDAASVLVLGPRESVDYAPVDHPGPDGPDLVLVTSGGADEWLRDWQDRAGGPPARVAVVGAGTTTASHPAPGSGDVEHVSVDWEGESPDLAGLGGAVEDVLAGWADTGARTVLWFRSVSDLLGAVDLRTAFRFLHVLTSRLRDRGVRGYFHLDPTAHDSEAVGTLVPLFDAVVTLPGGSDHGDAAVPGEFLDSPRPNLSGAGADARGHAGTAGGGAADGDDAAGGDAAGGSDVTGGAAVDGDDATDDETAVDEGDAHGGDAAGGGAADPAGTDSEDASRVLVVDATRDRAELVATVLDRPGLDVRATADTAAALDRVAAGGPDCVVSGQDLSGTTGTALFERVREADPDVPFLLLVSDPETGREAEAAGVTRWFPRDRAGYREAANFVLGAVAEARERRFREAVEHAGEPVALAGADGTVEHANPAFEALTGHAAPEVEGRDLRGFFADGLADGWAAVERGDTWTGEADLERGDGLPVRVSLSPVADADGGPRRVVAVLVDVSAYRERERELRAERDRARQAVELLAHDLRNVLQAVRGHLGFARDAVEQMDASLDRVDSLVEDVSALTADSAVEAVTERDLEDAVREAWAGLDTGEASLAVVESAPVQADQDLLARLLENLFANAVEHGSPESDGDGVTVRIGLVEDGFYVADDGVGIPPEDRDRVFDEGYSTTDSTGLGLVVVERVADAHGWEVGVTGSSRGGARFEVTGVNLG